MSTLLKSKNVNVNTQDKGGNTVLHSAVKNNDHQVIKILLANDKINLNIKNNNGDTALALAQGTIPPNTKMTQALLNIG